MGVEGVGRGSSAWALLLGCRCLGCVPGPAEGGKSINPIDRCQARSYVLFVVVGMHTHAIDQASAEHKSSCVPNRRDPPPDRVGLKCPLSSACDADSIPFEGSRPLTTSYVSDGQAIGRANTWSVGPAVVDRPRRRALTLRDVDQQRTQRPAGPTRRTRCRAVNSCWSCPPLATRLRCMGIVLLGILVEGLAHAAFFIGCPAPSASERKPEGQTTNSRQARLGVRSACRRAPPAKKTNLLGRGRTPPPTCVVTRSDPPGWRACRPMGSLPSAAKQLDASIDCCRFTLCFGYRKKQRTRKRATDPNRPQPTTLAVFSLHGQSSPSLLPCPAAGRPHPHPKSQGGAKSANPWNSPPFRHAIPSIRSGICEVAAILAACFAATHLVRWCSLVGTWYLTPVATAPRRRPFLGGTRGHTPCPRSRRVGGRPKGLPLALALVVEPVRRPNSRCARRPGWAAARARAFRGGRVVERPPSS